MEGNLGYMFAAYSIIWVALLVYVFTLSRRQQQLRRDLDRLKSPSREETK